MSWFEDAVHTASGWAEELLPHRKACPPGRVVRGLENTLRLEWGCSEGGGELIHSRCHWYDSDVRELSSPHWGWSDVVLAAVENWSTAGVTDMTQMSGNDPHHTEVGVRLFWRRWRTDPQPVSGLRSEQAHWVHRSARLSRCGHCLASPAPTSALELAATCWAPAASAESGSADWSERRCILS